MWSVVVGCCWLSCRVAGKLEAAVQPSLASRQCSSTCVATAIKRDFLLVFDKIECQVWVPVTFRSVEVKVVSTSDKTKFLSTEWNRPLEGNLLYFNELSIISFGIVLQCSCRSNVYAWLPLLLVSAWSMSAPSPSVAHLTTVLSLRFIVTIRSHLICADSPRLRQSLPN